jgi:hypothetical protein
MWPAAPNILRWKGGREFKTPRPIQLIYWAQQTLQTDSAYVPPLVLNKKYLIVRPAHVDHTHSIDKDSRSMQQYRPSTSTYWPPDKRNKTDYVNTVYYLNDDSMVQGNKANKQPNATESKVMSDVYWSSHTSTTYNDCVHWCLTLLSSNDTRDKAMKL